MCIIIIIIIINRFLVQAPIQMRQMNGITFALQYSSVQKMEMQYKPRKRSQNIIQTYFLTLQSENKI